MQTQASQHLKYIWVNYLPDWPLASPHNMPWDNCNVWLGVKQQIAYLLTHLIMYTHDPIAWQIHCLQFGTDSRAHFAGTFMTFSLSLWAHSIPCISSTVVSQADKLLAFILPKWRVKSFPLLSSHGSQSPLFIHRGVATLKFRVNTICNWELVAILHSRKRWKRMEANMQLNTGLS